MIEYLSGPGVEGRVMSGASSSGVGECERGERGEVGDPGSSEDI